MKVALTGSHGLVGGALMRHLEKSGDQAVRLVRPGSSPGESVVRWDPATGYVESKGLENLGALVHLAGENLASGRWTNQRKLRIRQSRVQATRLLCDSLAQLRNPPPVLVSASAIGFYGDRGDEILTEESPPGSGFLAELCQEWEAATAPAQQAGIRVVSCRLAMILSRSGGALAKMLPVFRLGLGGPIGHGRQYWSWIALEDVVRAIGFAISSPSLAGPLNFSAPQSVTNARFTQALGKVLRRPTIFPLPGWMAKLLLGEMAEGALLSSSRVHPKTLLSSGFQFHFTHLDSALRALMEQSDDGS